MKPLNLNKETCNPISSNCVVWQGPDMPCIKLCKGDTVSDVVAKLAVELCAVLDTLDVTNYNLDCFNLTACGPTNFEQLIQFIIDQICELNDLINSPTAGKPISSGCPDCIVSVADCFIPELGTSTQLTTYVQTIAMRVCTLVLQIGVIQATLVSLDGRVSILESYFPLPAPAEAEITPDCILPAIPTPVSVVLTALETAWCNLIGVLGDDAAIYNSIISQCVADGDLRKDGGGTMSSLPGWFSSPVQTLAESIVNIWLTVCDLRSMTATTLLSLDTQTIQTVITGGPAYVVSANLVDTGWYDLEGFDYYGVNPPGSAMINSKPKCRRVGNVIHFKGSVYIPMSATVDGLTLIPLLTDTSYNGTPVPYVYSGVDVTYGNGCIIDPLNGIINFNANNNCIPTAIWTGTSPLLDDNYSTSYVIGTRPINLDTSYGTSLSAVGQIRISNAGILSIATLRNLELTSTRPAGLLGNSHLRYITSNVRFNEFVPNFINGESMIHNLPTINQAVSTGEITGTVFTDTTHGAGVFSIGQILTGTGVTPGTKIIGYGTGTGTNNGGTYDINISQVVAAATVIKGTDSINLNSTSYDVINTAVSTTVWPFSCNAGDADQLGGFVFVLDGLMSYIQP
jgi:hypothetical protein